MKLLLIQPAQMYPDGTLIRFQQSIGFPVGLVTLAALTPPDVEITIQNECVDSIDLDAEVDLVGITGYTSQITRGYHLADEFRKRSKKVVMGGIHISLNPDEAECHADAILIGEAEGLWPQIIEDVRKGRLQTRYQQTHYPDMSRSALPRYDLVEPQKYISPPSVKSNLIPIQTARGCPYRCDFCSVVQFQGRRFRMKPIPHVLKEIEACGSDYLFFSDDNVIGDIDRARKFFKAITPLNVKWMGQFPSTIGRHPELIDLAAKSGCFLLFVGFETIVPESLREVGKSFNQRQDYRAVVRRILNAGITPFGSFAFGFDHDDPDVFERTLDFAESSNMPLVSFFILTPLPGTVLYQHLSAEKRIFDHNWHNYDLSRVVFRPARMSPEELQEKYWNAFGRFYSRQNIVKRIKQATTDITIQKMYAMLSRSMIAHRINPLSGGVLL
ncbi:MAG: B12-binding domain-containing radical SAM protein [bacterium]|nr:B12-binding domain-containing radical SAM protein [bacterium]